MELIDYIVSQGFPREVAEELAERARKNPRLVMCEHRGKFVKLKPPTEAELERVNQMLESGQTPFLMTDSTYLEGHANGSQFEKTPSRGDALKKACEAMGGSTTGKVYVAQLASCFGDPKAWVSGRGDVQKVCEERNMGCEGAVTVKQREMDEPPPPPIQVADRLVHERTAKELAGQVVTGKQYKAKFAEVKDKITPPWKRGKRA